MAEEVGFGHKSLSIFLRRARKLLSVRDPDSAVRYFLEISGLRLSNPTSSYITLRAKGRSGLSRKSWRCFLDEVRTMYEQNPQDFDD